MTRNLPAEATKTFPVVAITMTNIINEDIFSYMELYFQSNCCLPDQSLTTIVIPSSQISGYYLFLCWNSRCLSNLSTARVTRGLSWRWPVRTGRQPRRLASLPSAAGPVPRLLSKISRWGEFSWSPAPSHPTPSHRWNTTYLLTSFGFTLV